MSPLPTFLLIEDVQINLKMATESTQIARASHRDSRSLRIIQILSVLFLPASLVSSIFGMGFFTTSQGVDGQPVLMTSSSWWLYIAVSVPLNIVYLVVLGGFNMISKTNKRRNTRQFDMEK